jgi:Sec-independent protein secretion pathway component TatC
MIAVLVVFLPLAFFSNELFTIIAKPLIDKLPEGNSLIATSVIAPFMTPLKLALFAAIYVAIPASIATRNASRCRCSPRASRCSTPARRSPTSSSFR